jgi:5-methylthioadenosine/S-adenosylhomocysteine deaminase
MSLAIRNVLLDGKETSIYIEGNIIRSIGGKEKADIVIDGKNKAAFPGFVNTHTHAAMTLFRSYADDLRLYDWLENHIWPREAKMTEEDVYWGTKLACLEMIKSGTTCFNDNYWHVMGAAKATSEMGLRAAVSEVFIDLPDSSKVEELKKKNVRLIKKVKGMKNSRIIPALSPHAPYTVSPEGLMWIKETADKEKLLINIHLGETEKESRDYMKIHGRSPVPFFEKIGFLGSNVIAAHGIWFNHKDIDILSKYKVKISHNPISNMKLASGILKYKELLKAGITVSLGTDGTASNNNLDMFDSMKFASLLQKVQNMDPTIAPATEIFKMATLKGAETLGINAGAIEVGKLADIQLINLKMPELTPNNNLISNLVYSAKGSCVDTLICDGKILMQDRRVEGEEKIIEKANSVAKDLFSR